MTALALLTTEQIESQRQHCEKDQNMGACQAAIGFTCMMCAVVFSSILTDSEIVKAHQIINSAIPILTILGIFGGLVTFFLGQHAAEDAQGKQNQLADAKQSSCADLAAYQDHPEVRDYMTKLQPLDRVLTQQEANALLALARRDMERDRCKSLYLDESLAATN